MAEEQKLPAFGTLFDNIKKNPDTKQLAITQVKLDDKNPYIAGTLVKIEEVTSADTEKNFFVYTVEFAGELYCFAPGKQIDRFLSDGKYVGYEIAVKYVGSSKLSKNRTLNQYEIMVQPPSVEAAIPF